jgi:DNA repair exonuclease SbcCD nuclease subunit
MVLVIVFGTKVFSKLRGARVPLNVAENTLTVGGLTNEYKIFLLADSHISLVDERDPDVQIKAQSRQASFSANGVPGHQYFKQLLKRAEQDEADIIILGGDIIDSAMYASVDYVYEQTSALKTPYLYLTGNHDFEYGSEYFSETAYTQYKPRLFEVHGNKDFRVVEYDDLVIYSADDENNQISEEALEAYKTAAKKGKPMVVCLHVPLEPEEPGSEFVQACKDVWGASDDGHSRVSIGPEGCYINEITQEFRDLVLADDSPVVLVLAGHIHFYRNDSLNANTRQIVTGAAYEGNAVEVTLRPPQR